MQLSRLESWTLQTGADLQTTVQVDSRQPSAGSDHQQVSKCEAVHLANFCLVGLVVRQGPESDTVLSWETT